MPNARDVTSRVPLAAALAAALLGALVYLNALGGPFVGDDVIEIRDNPRVHSLAGIPDLWTGGLWGDADRTFPLYRPVAATVTTILYAGGGGRPALFHLWSVALHAAATALAVILLLDLGFGTFVAISAGLLFAVHPVHTEAVAWISHHSEILAAALLIGAWVAHLRGRRIAAGCCLALALLTKESAAVFPALALAGDLLRGARAGRRRAISWPALIGYTILVAIFIGLRALVVGHPFGGEAVATHAREMLNPLIGQPVATRLLTSVKVTGIALAQSLFPATLCLDYGYRQIPIVSTLLDPGFIRATLMLAGAGALAWAARISRPMARAVALGMGIFLVTLLPTSNLLFAGLSIFAERYLYLPVLGICLAAAGLIGAVRWKPARVALVGACVAALGARTIARNPEFADQVTLARAEAAACPDSAGAHASLGSALREAGRLDESEAALQKALRIAPHYAGARADLGLTLMLAGRIVDAEAALTEALRLRPSDWRARSNLAELQLRTGRVEEALSAYAALAAEMPGNAEVVGNHAAALFDAGRTEEARAIFERLETSEPGSAAGPNGLGGLAAREGRWDQAAELFGEAVRREPLNANAVYNLARALSRTGRNDEAARALRRALDAGLVDPGIEQLLQELHRGR